MNNNIKIGIATSIVLIIVFSMFYWFQLRPANIKAECAKWNAGTYYTACLHKKGL